MEGRSRGRGRRGSSFALIGRLGLGAVIASMAAVIVMPARAVSSVTLPTSVEAWYQTPATNAPSPPGQPAPAIPASPPPANPYGAGTLHVGIKAGAEDARVYVQLDTTTLAASTTLLGATLVLPIDPAHGTTNPQAAQLDICITSDPGPPVEGSFAQPPAVDCSVSASASYEASPRPRFVADVTSFGLDALRGGLAVVPAGVARTARATWHVSFFGRQTAASELDAIHADLEVDVANEDADEDFDASSVPGVPSGDVDEDTSVFDVDERPGFLDSPSSRLIPEGQDNDGGGGLLSGGGSRVATPVASSGPLSDGKFRYPIVLVVPVAVSVLFGVLGSSLTARPRVVRSELEA